MKSLPRNPKFALTLVVLLAAGMWCYVDLILIPHEITNSARLGEPRGNLSDLYPRWLGTRELLLHKRDPYSAEVTREIQIGYYGRPLDARRPNDPKDQQAFAYPVYVAFLLAPTVRFAFVNVQFAFRWILFLLIAGSIPIWLSALRWRISTRATLAAVLLVLGSFPAVQALKLQQLTAVVCALLAACAAAVVNGYPVLAGFLLGLATIKPQLTIPLAAWLAVWALGNWRSRQSLIWSFLITLLALVLGGELLLPGWVSRFRDSAFAYLEYAGGKSLLEFALGPGWGRIVSFVPILVVIFGWCCRRAPADSEAFRWTTALMLTAILAVAPRFSPYNELLLIPALLLLARDGLGLCNGSQLQRVLLVLVIAAIAFSWLAALTLDVMLLFLPRETVERAWAVPLWTTWVLPLVVLAATALRAAQISLKESNSSGVTARTIP